MCLPCSSAPSNQSIVLLLTRPIARLDHAHAHPPHALTARTDTRSRRSTTRDALRAAVADTTMFAREMSHRGTRAAGQVSNCARLRRQLSGRCRAFERDQELGDIRRQPCAHEVGNGSRRINRHVLDPSVRRLAHARPAAQYRRRARSLGNQLSESRIACSTKEMRRANRWRMARSSS